MKGTSLTLVGIVCLALILTALPIWSGCRQSEPVYLKPSGEPVDLVNNSAARDHPWQEVLDFLKRDTTDQEPYTPERGSAYFAELLHNRAEYYGFKTAFVVVEFENGETHALNAFNTVDYGLAYIDCTPQIWDRAAPPDIVLDYEIPKEYYEISIEYEDSWLWDAHWDFHPMTFEFPSHTSWDKVGFFVEQGEKLGFVSADCLPLQFNNEWYMEVHALIEPGDLLWEALRGMVDEYEERVQAWFEVKGASMNPHDCWVDEECRNLRDEQERKKGLAEITIEVLELNVPFYWQESESPVASVEIHW